MLTRTEEIKLRCEMPYVAYMANKFLVDTLLGRAVPAMGGDTLIVNYGLTAHYYGDLEKSLRAIIALRELGITFTVDVEELRHGRSLIADVLCHLDTILEGQ